MADYGIGATGMSFGDMVFGVRRDTVPAVTTTTNAGGSPASMDSYGGMRVTFDGGAPTYSATSQFACDSTGTDIAYVTGNTLCVAKLLKIIVSTVATAAAPGNITIERRSTANTAGTAVSASVGKRDTRNAAANLAPKHYTAHPTALGTTAGVLAAEAILQGAVGTGVGRVEFDFTQLFGAQALRVGASVTDIIAVNVAAALGAAGNLWTVTWVWVELPLTA